MTTDLFEEMAQKQPEVAQNWSAKTSARSGCATAPLPPFRGGVAARSGAPSAPSREVAQKQGVSGARLAHVEKCGKTSFGDLRARAEQLQTELEAAHAEVETAKRTQDPFQAAFESIDRHLRELSTARYMCSRRFVRDKWFALLDKRMAAGHAWNPHRAALRKAEHWRNAVLSDLKSVNEEIGL